MKRKVTVVATEQWMDTLHGASILSLLSSLAKLGYNINIMIPSYRKRKVDARIGNGSLAITTFEIKKPIPVLSLLYMWREALKAIIKEKSRILIFDYPMLPIYVISRILWKSKGILLIWSRPVGLKDLSGLLRTIHFRISLILSKYFAFFITAITPFEAEEFSRMGKIPKDKIIVIPSPLSEIFEEANTRLLKSTVRELRKKLGLEALLDKTVLLYHGVLDENRGIMDLLKLFMNAFQGSDDIVLLIVGDGPARNLVIDFIKHNRVTNIVFLGPHPYTSMPEIIMASDIGLVMLPDHPWWRYQCPTKLVELLAMGKPVIASDLPGIRWIADNLSNVVYIREWKSESLKEAVRRAMVLSLEGIRSQEARTMTIRRFSSKYLAVKLSRIIQQLE